MQDMHDYRCEKNGFLVATDPALLDLDAIHDFLSHSYWAEGIPRETVARSLKHSLCFGLYEKNLASADAQIGLARVVSDYTTFAYLCDVYVLESHRGQGLGTWFMDCVMRHPDLQGLRRFNLVTRDAHGLYEKLGFAVTTNPGGYMEILKRNLYKNPEKPGN